MGTFSRFIRRTDRAVAQAPASNTPQPAPQARLKPWPEAIPITRRPLQPATTRAESPRRTTCTARRQLAFDTGVQVDRRDWNQVYSACLGPSRVIQLAAAEQVVRNRGWYVDFDVGTLSFGQDSFPVQFLGSEATDDETWMWGWHNINNFDPGIIAIARHLHAIGRGWGLKELTTASFSLTPEVDGHALAVVASVLAPQPVAYYRGPHAGGAVLLAFSGLPESVFAPADQKRVTRVVSDCLSIPCDHRLLVEGLLCWNGTDYSWQGNQLLAQFPEGMVFEFDEQSRLTRMATRVAA